MLGLVHEASRALSAHDAEALERLAAKLRTHVDYLGSNRAELARAIEVLTAQVKAARAHLALSERYRQVASATTWEVQPWGR